MADSKVFNMDCMEAMKDIPDKYFELAIIDPPYGIGFDSENLSMSCGLRKDGSKRVCDNWSNPVEKGYSSKEWDIKPNDDYFKELLRVSENQIIWGGNYFNLPLSGSWIVWDKGVKMPTLSKCELAWCSIGNHIEICRVLWAGYLKINGEDNRIHPTQKPVALYKWLLKNYAKTGDKILDTHLGSGSSRIACFDMGFDFTGYELDKEYFDKSVERYENHISQQVMFKDDIIDDLEQKELFKENE